MKKIMLHGMSINVDEDDRGLVLYLEDHLTREEFDTIFGYARYKKQAYFQDHDRHHFSVVYDDDVYTIDEA
jgi:hypothetical protein